MFDASELLRSRPRSYQLPREHDCWLQGGALQQPSLDLVASAWFVLHAGWLTSPL